MLQHMETHHKYTLLLSVAGVQLYARPLPASKTKRCLPGPPPGWLSNPLRSAPLLSLRGAWNTVGQPASMNSPSDASQPSIHPNVEMAFNISGIANQPLESGHQQPQLPTLEARKPAVCRMP